VGHRAFFLQPRVGRVHFIAPNLAQADIGIRVRNDKPSLLRPMDRYSSQQAGLLELAKSVANGGP
jgi:hypothetical protein